MKKLLFFLLIFFSQTSISQISDIDLKAGYCLRIQVLDIEQTEDVIKIYKQNKLDISTWESAINEATKRLNRLRDYLDAKLNGDYGLIISSAKRANEDYPVLAKCGVECISLNTSTGKKCLESCDKKNGYPLTRFNDCKNLSWLPY
jgi:hypothetical protein